MVSCSRGVMISFLGKFLAHTYIYVIICTSLQVIPPGMEFHHIVPQDGDLEGETEGNEEHPTSPDPHIWSEVQIIPFVFTLMCPRRF